MFGGAEISLKEQMINLRDRLLAISRRLPDIDFDFEIVIALVEDIYAKGKNLDDTPAIASVLKYLNDHILHQIEVDKDSIWYGPYNDNNNEFGELVDTTLDYMKELWEQLKPVANANANGMNQDGGRRRKTRSGKSKTFRTNRRRMFGGAVQTLQERMVELLKENLSQIRSELFPYADDRINILISYIQDEFEEGQPFEDKQALAHMLNKTYKHIKKELNHYPLPPTKWAKKYNDDDEFKKIVDSTLDQLAELLDELEPEANAPENAMPLDGGRRRKTRSRKSRKSRNSRRRRRLSKRKLSKRK